MFPGKTLVQVVEDEVKENTFAVKFFMDWGSFLLECGLYASLFPYVGGFISRKVLKQALATHDGSIGRSAAAPVPKHPESIRKMHTLLAKCLPRIEAVYDGAPKRVAQDVAGGSTRVSAGASAGSPLDGVLVDSKGRPLPPCIVMERAESLHDWSDRAKPDLFTAMSVRAAVYAATCASTLWCRIAWI